MNSPLVSTKVARAVTLVIAIVGITLAGVRVLSAQNRFDQDDRSRTLVGSWLMTYNFPTFSIPVLLSFTADGIVIETDYPGPETSDPQGASIFSNGHGEWDVSRSGTFTCLYRKIIYKNDSAQFGLTKSKLDLTVTRDGKQLQGNGPIQFADLHGNIVFSLPVTVTGKRIVVEE